MSNINYRPELDGLRAISVLGVLLYHANLGFPGGYVGVDIFFVISGFLITSIIAKGLDNGSFSFAEFWIRRIKRILPAVSAMVVAVLATALFVLDPEALKDLADSAVAQSTMWSNFYFQNASGGYFHTKTELMPLLHTWSLAVEEQFYLLLPLLLFLLFKYPRKRAVVLLAGIASVSFVLSVILTKSDPSQSFYLLHTRAWELLAGSLLALSAHKIRLGKKTAEGISLAGLALVFGPMFWLDTYSSFPGLNAVAPVAGAVAFIAGTGSHNTLAGRLASRPTMVFFGKISYSLYLWHWPLFAFSRHLFVQADQLWIKLILLFASVLLAVLSWKFIETPFRGADHLKTRASAVRFGIAVTAILCIVAGAISLQKGYPGRLNEYAELLRDMDAHGEEYKSKGKGVVIGDQSKEAADFILWGDSHGMMIAGGMDRCASEHGLKGMAYLNTARIPVTNLRRPRFNKDIINYNRQVFDRIIESDIKHLILASRWSVNLNDETGIRLVSDRTDNKAETSMTDAAESLERQLGNMLQVCRSKGIKVYMIRQIPENTDDLTARHFYTRKRYPALNPGTPDRYTAPLHDHLSSQAVFEKILGAVTPDDHLMVLDPAPAFFDNEQGRLEAYGEERSHYRDDNHLTEYGVDQFVTPVLETIFLNIRAP